MRTLYLFAALLLFPLAAGASFMVDDPVPCASGSGVSFETAFSPAEPLGPLVAKMIVSAKKSVRVAAREFTSKPVSEALDKALRAGKDVKVLLDGKSNDNGYSAASFLQIMSQEPHMIKGADLYEDYIIIDDSEVIVGAIAALPDAEAEKKFPASILIIHNAPDLAKRYMANWQALWDASEVMPKYNKK